MSVDIAYTGVSDHLMILRLDKLIAEETTNGKSDKLQVSYVRHFKRLFKASAKFSEVGQSTILCGRNL